MSIQPWYTGQTLPAMEPTFEDDNGNAINLTGATITLKFRNQQTNQDQVGAGTWNILSATGGIAQYSWASADVATAGSYLIYVDVTYSGGKRTFDPVPFIISNAP